MKSSRPRDSSAAASGGGTRPPLLFLACLLVAVALDRIRPWPPILPEAASFRWTTGGALSAIGATRATLTLAG